ncbi:hypothetical protein AFM18_11570 [Achromobacter spanius]|uniref:Uncharacterized protein n=1 Tax=Achromobacter spanius TaxID=217203 RepID=A0AAW3I4D3_9BURK|nr:hypothetical protein AFM18_11570 [Achromobacter spanius]
MPDFTPLTSLATAAADLAAAGMRRARAHMTGIALHPAFSAGICSAISPVVSPVFSEVMSPPVSPPVGGVRGANPPAVVVIG